MYIRRSVLVKSKIALKNVTINPLFGFNWTVLRKYHHSNQIVRRSGDLHGRTYVDVLDLSSFDYKIKGSWSKYINVLVAVITTGKAQNWIDFRTNRKEQFAYICLKRDALRPAC